MDPFLSDRHARWHPVDLSLFPLRPPPRRPSIITRSLTLARYATTPVTTMAMAMGDYGWSMDFGPDPYYKK